MVDESKKGKLTERAMRLRVQFMNSPFGRATRGRLTARETAAGASKKTIANREGCCSGQTVNV